MKYSTRLTIFVLFYILVTNSLKYMIIDDLNLSTNQNVIYFLVYTFLWFILYKILVSKVWANNFRKNILFYSIGLILIISLKINWILFTQDDNAKNNHSILPKIYTDNPKYKAMYSVSSKYSNLTKDEKIIIWNFQESNILPPDEILNKVGNETLDILLDIKNNK